MAKTPDQIRAEIMAARNQLMDDLRSLSSEVHPSIIKQRTVQNVKDAVTDRATAAKGLVMDEAGIRWDRIGTVVLAILGLIVVRGVLRGIARFLFH